jgi:hypothetical protein
VFLFSYPLIPLAAVRRVSQTCRPYDPAWEDFEACHLSIYISTGALRNPEIRDEVECLCDGVCNRVRVQGLPCGVVAAGAPWKQCSQHILESYSPSQFMEVEDVGQLVRPDNSAVANVHMLWTALSLDPVSWFQKRVDLGSTRRPFAL